MKKATLGTLLLIVAADAAYSVGVNPVNSSYYRHFLAGANLGEVGHAVNHSFTRIGRKADEVKDFVCSVGLPAAAGLAYEGLQSAGLAPFSSGTTMDLQDISWTLAGGVAAWGVRKGLGEYFSPKNNGHSAPSYSDSRSGWAISSSTKEKLKDKGHW